MPDLRVPDLRVIDLRVIDFRVIDWRVIRPASLIMVPCAVLGWLFYYNLFRTTPGQDWMVFDTAAHAYLRGDAALLLDGPRFTAVLNASHPWLAEPLRFHPWIYPPSTLLLALPFAALPWWASFSLFQCLGAASLAASLCLWAGGVPRRVLIAGVFLCAATAFNVGAGQSGTLSASLLTAGVWFLHRRPGLAGAMLGLLVFKPQLAILLPVALFAARAWRAILWAGLTASGIMAASLLVPGLALWRAWLQLFLGGDPAFARWIAQGRLYGQSVYSCARLAGLSDHAAGIAQCVAIGLAALCVGAVFRVRANACVQLAILLCGTTLAAPHFGNYDAVMLGEACMLVLLQAPSSRGGPRIALSIAIYCSLSFQPPFVIRPAAITPLLVAGLLLAETWRVFRNARVDSPPFYDADMPG